VIEKLENLDRRVIVAEDLAGRCLPDELLNSRLDKLGAIAHHFPLRGSRQRYTQIAFKLFEA
jgi:hypothetical protein